MINKQKTIFINGKYPDYNGYQHIEVFTETPSLNILKTTYIPSINDKIYIFPDCNIPRFKVKEFCENNGVSIVKYKTKANILFTNKNNINNSYFLQLGINPYFNSIKSITKKAMLKYLNLVKLKYDGIDLINLIKDIEDLQNDFVLVTSNIHRHCTNKGLFNGPSYNFIEESDLMNYDNNGEVLPYDKSLIEINDNHDYYSFISEENETEFYSLLNHQNVYDESALVSLLNSQTIMDEEMYKGILNLFDSSDANNHILAMETMANCNYLKSAGYLLMLYSDYSYLINKKVNKNHINFKSFLSFFKLNRGCSISIDDIVDKLKEKKLLNRSNLNIVLKKAENLIINASESATNYFTYKYITPIKSIIEEMEKTEAEDLLKPQLNLDTSIKAN